MAGLIAGLGAVSVVVLPAQVASAATDTVTTCAGSGAGSLPAVIAGAAAGDTVTFASGLSCPPASPISLTATITLGQSLTISGPGATTMAVSGAHAGFSVLTINSGAVVTISGLTIENGAGTTTNSSLGGVVSGGGIENSGTLTLTSSTVSGNSAADSSANDIVASGGGIENSGTLTLTNSTVSGNSVPGFLGAGGGGIDNSGTLNVSSSTVSGNSVSVGMNTSNAQGGGISNEGAANITNSTVAGNSASSGFGATGGGIYNTSTLVITSSTVADNSATFNGGIVGNADLGSTIVAGNTGGDCSGTYTDQGYNLSDDASCGFSTANNDLPSINPMLGVLENNGGPTATMALGFGSPAIDHVTVASLCPATDQRGFARKVPCDIGAYDTDTPAHPAGYKIVAAAQVAAPGVRTTALVACPARTSPVGGGVHSAASNAFALNSSYPLGADWVVTVSNTGTANLAFQTFAVCIRQPATTYTKTATAFTVPSNSQAEGLYNCPVGVEVGEGVATASTSTAVTVNTLGNGATTAQVLTYVNNPTATSVAATLYAICAKTAPAGYSVQTSAAVADPPGGLANAHVACPGFSVPLSGGLFTPDGFGLQQFVSNTVFLGSTTKPNGWGANMANNDGSAATIWTATTCAGV